MLVHTYNHFWKSATETTFCKSHFVVDFCLMLCKSLWPHQINGYYKSLPWHIMWIILSHWLKFLITNQGELLGIAAHHMTRDTLYNFTPLLATNHHFLPPLWPHSTEQGQHFRKREITRVLTCVDGNSLVNRRAQARDFSQYSSTLSISWWCTHTQQPLS